MLDLGVLSSEIVRCRGFGAYQPKQQCSRHCYISGRASRRGGSRALLPSWQRGCCSPPCSCRQTAHEALRFICTA